MVKWLGGDWGVSGFRVGQWSRIGPIQPRIRSVPGAFPAKSTTANNVDETDEWQFGSFVLKLLVVSQ